MKIKSCGGLVKNHKLLIIFIILGFPIRAYCEINVEDYCFAAVGQKGVRFELRTYFDDSVKWSGAFLRYEKSKEMIPLVLEKVEEDVTSEGRSAELTRKWLEILEGNVTGEYEMKSQGASIESMSYKNYKTKKSFDFMFDANSQRTDRMGCSW
jgi:hypothetical protein